MADPHVLDVVFIHGVLSSAKAWKSFEELIGKDADLSDRVTMHFFEYNSPKFQLRPDRRIAEIDDIADRLRTYLLTELQDAASVVLVTHSQGGLVVQRFLARMLSRGQGRDLARIKRITMFACPNTGAEFLLSVRKFALRSRHPQETQLRPFNRTVLETQQVVLRSVVNARTCNDSECYIPIEAYGGVTDRIVPPVLSSWMWPVTHVVDGDHSSVIRPTDHNASSYRVLKAALLEAGKSHDETVSLESGLVGERQGRLSVTPPIGRRDAPLQGRDDLIAKMRAATERAPVHVLAGLGGSGKSRLALEAAYRAQSAGTRVWWVPVGRINSCMREVALQLGAPQNQVEIAWRGTNSATDLLWQYLNNDPRPWLLVLDNADDPQRLAALNSPVADGTGWLRRPTARHGTVIVTSRDRNEATWGTWCLVHVVQPLDVNYGASMLIDQLGSAAGTYEEARALSAELGGLPLALRAAGNYLKSALDSKVWSGKDSINDFSGYRDAVKRRFSAPAGTSSSTINEPMGFDIVRGVFSMSLELLEERGLDQAAPLIKMLACLSFAPIPYDVFLNQDVLAGSPLFAHLTMKQRVTVLEGLADLGLIEPHRLEGVQNPALSHVLSLHPVVHGLLRADADVHERHAEYYGLNLQLLINATKDSDPDYPESWELWDVLAPHTLEMAEVALIEGPERVDQRNVILALELARLTGRYLIVTGLLEPANRLLSGIIAKCTSFGFHESDREILALRHETARIALERGTPEVAESELRVVIAEREQKLGESHPDTLASRHKLAKAILEQGRWAEAEPLLNSIVIAEREVRGPEHPDTMVVRHSLARAILALDRPQEAEAMLRNILETRSRIWSPATPETLFVRRSLSRSLLAQERAQDAADELREALAHASDRPDAPEVLALRHALSAALVMQDRVTEAVANLDEVLAARRKVLGPRHPETLRTLNLLSKAQTALDRPSDDDHSSNEAGNVSWHDA